VRAFVTGASGFVGRHLVAHLEASGDEVVALPDGIDVADEVAVREAVVGARPDAIYHLAGWAHVGASFDHAAEVVRVNVAGTAAVCDAALAAGGPRVLVVGSSDAYGAFDPAELPLHEGLPLRPVSPYGASKAAAEVVALQAWRGRGLPVVVSRSFNHTGPGQSTTFVVPALARRIVEAVASGAPTVRVGNLSARRDLVDVRDVVRAYRALVERGEPGGTYNVCSGQAVAVSELAERLVRLAGADLELVVDPDLVRPVDVPVVVGDHGRITERTGWRPERSLDDTVAAVLEDQRAALSRPV
jgi:GDP-4-dehydro-6-deoxy-D-mannose reductase